MTTTNLEEKRLPETTLKKAIKSGNEFGWRQTDLIDTIETARKLNIGIVGGQVQYVFPVDNSVAIVPAISVMLCQSFR